MLPRLPNCATLLSKVRCDPYYRHRSHVDYTNTDEVINLEDDQWADINIVSGCLKLYLRELPDPLIPFRMFRGFIDAASKLWSWVETVASRL